MTTTTVMTDYHRIRPHGIAAGRVTTARGRLRTRAIAPRVPVRTAGLDLLVERLGLLLVTGARRHASTVVMTPTRRRLRVEQQHAVDERERAGLRMQLTTPLH